MSDAMNAAGIFRCCVVRRAADGLASATVEQQSLTALPAGDVRIRVHWSSLNYKDALAVSGHPGIVRSFPHVPGIDAAGIVESSTNSAFAVGDSVITTGHELGVERWGGWGEYIQIPASWLLPLPQNLSFEEAMALGTAGFTAAQCVESLIRHRITPESGEILITGATGGVGSLAIQILSQLGYRVVAVTGKVLQTEWLLRLGATRVMLRDELLTLPQKPLLKSMFAGAVDTVGGQLLSVILRTLHHRGCVAACGVAGGADVATTVYPFILRGVTLAGIDSAWCPDEDRAAIWQKLSAAWKPKLMLDRVRRVSLDEAIEVSRQMLSGHTTGRTLVQLD